MNSLVSLRRAALALLLAPTLTSGLTAQQGELRGLDAYIERAIDGWDVPGLALAVVKGDSVVYAKGYGVRRLGSSEPVDPQTLFAIGSASKAFSAAAVAILVDEDRLDWDDPATKYLPGFQMYDPYVTRELTVRDLLTHRSGLSRGDLLWYGTDYDREEILRRVRHLEPTWSLRSHFGYQNLMYLASGEVVEEVTGQTWDDFIERRLFDPLGMDASSTTIRALAGQRNVASPHATVDDEVRPVAWRNIDNIAPAGSINSNVLDMAQWVRMQLDHGTYRGEEIIDADVFEEMHAPQTIIPNQGGWARMAPGSHFLTYGMGWILNDFRGHKVVQHGGNIDGMSALVGMLPEEDVGVVILTNMNGSGVTHPVMYRVFDAYLGGAPTDWSGQALARRDSLRQAAEARGDDAEDARVSGTTPSLALTAYTGTYENELYGDATVTLEQGSLVLRFGPAFTGELEHWHFDTFRVAWGDPMQGRMFVDFDLDAMAEVASMSVQGIAEFERTGDLDAATASR